MNREEYIEKFATGSYTKVGYAGVYKIVFDKINKILIHKIPDKQSRVFVLSNLIGETVSDWLLKQPDMKENVKLLLQEYYMMLILSIDTISDNGQLDKQKWKEFTNTMEKMRHETNKHIIKLYDDDPEGEYAVE